MGQNVLSQSEQISEISLLIQIHLKVDQNIFGWAWSEIGVASLAMGL